MRRVAAGARFSVGLAAGRDRGVLGAAPEDFAAVAHRPVMTAVANALFPECLENLGRGEAGREEHALPDVAKGALLLGIVILAAGGLSQDQDRER